MNMAWLRVDDGFTQHPKITKLARAERWTWLEILCYVARYRTKGVVPAAIGEVIRGASPAYLNRCFELDLLDLNGDDYIVHDWDHYNGPDPKAAQAERQRKRRDSAVTDAVTAPVQERDESRDESVTHAQARGRVPVPSPTREEQPLRTNEQPSRLTEADVAAAREARQRSGWVDDLNSYTGCRYIRGTHGASAVHDVLGTEPPPADWGHPRPTRAEIVAALAKQSIGQEVA